MRNRNILITGGSGFIGSNMAAYQLAEGNQVWAVDNLITGQTVNIQRCLSHQGFRFDQADITQWDKLTEAVKWADRIYHFAASVGQKFVLKNPIYTIKNNVYGCEAVLESMVKANSYARFLLASTSELYYHSLENARGEAIPESATISFPPGNFLQETYSVSKLNNEITTLSYVYEKGLDCTIARIFNTIGLNQSPAYGMVVPTFFRQALADEQMTVYGDGLQSRSFSDVRDTIKALDLLMDQQRSKGEIYNVGDDRECSIIELAHLIKKMTKSKSEIRYLTYQEAYGVPFTDVRRRQPDLRKLKQLTGFAPRYTLEETLDHILLALDKRNTK